MYNITPYLHYHPGGADILLKAAGRDCTGLFNRYHAWVNLDGLAGVSVSFRVAGYCLCVVSVNVSSRPSHVNRNRNWWWAT